MSWLLVARGQLRESWRSREFPGIVALFAFVFGALGAYFGYLSGTDAWPFPEFLAFPVYVSVVLVPMIGVVLGTDVVAGPREDGRLRLLLGQPISRGAFVGGTYLARAVVLVAGIVAGGTAFVLAAAVTGGTVPVGEFARFVLLTAGLGVAYLGVAVAVSTLARTTDWTTFAVFSAFVVFVLVWRFVPAGIALVLNGLAMPEPQPVWVGIATGLSPSVAYEYLFDQYVRSEVAVWTTDAADGSVFAAVLAGWIVLVPALAYRHFRTADL